MAEMNLLKSLFFVGTQTILAKLNMLLAKTNKHVLYNTETSFLINYQSLNINIYIYKQYRYSLLRLMELMEEFTHANSNI